MMLSKKSNSAKHAFFYLLAFFTLGFTAIAIGQVFFQLINKVFPETTWGYMNGFENDILHFAISALIVAGPIYYFTTRQINKELASGKLDPHAGVRRWLTYLILLIASATAIGDLIAVLNNFLSGEITTQFFFKALTILLITVGFGGYYVYDLSRKKFKRDKILNIFSGGFLATALTALIIAFTLVGSPWKAREMREDRDRINDLQNISYQIAEIYEEQKKIPATLKEMVSNFDLDKDDVYDPATKEIYEYRILGSKKYELCATLIHPSDYRDEEWSHDVGRQCFEVEVNLRESDGWSYYDAKPVGNR